MKLRLLAVTILLLVSMFLVSCQQTVATDQPGAGNTGTGGDTGQIDATDAAGAVGDAVGCADVDADQLVTTGTEVYNTQCAACHGPQGEGQGDFPALTNNANLTAADTVQVVQGFFDPEAHPFVENMTAQDIAAVLTYARTTFGNATDPICPEIVEGISAGS